MTRRSASRISAIALPVLLATTLPAHAAEGGLEIFPDQRVLVLIAFFLLLVYPAQKLLFAPLLRVIDERRDRIDGARGRADDLSREADEVLGQYEAAAQVARESAEQGRRSALEQARRDQTRVTAEARNDAGGVITHARAEVELALADARAQLRALAFVSSFPASASASVGVGSGFLFEVLNLVLLLGVLAFLTRKPISNYLADRRDTIRNNIETAEKLYQDAESRLAEWRQRAEGLDAEVESIREAARKSAEQEAAGILADAQATAERIRASAHSTVEGELRRARAALRDEAANLAIELAGGQLREQVTDADRDRLVDEFVTRIENGDKS